MGKYRNLSKKRKLARGQLEKIFSTPEHTLIIHYSCESFYDRNNPLSPRVTSIAVRNLDSGQTKSFSIHLVAERIGHLNSIDQHYDELEKAMLEDFFLTVSKRQHCQWVHWNMRDANYGFEALENRLCALGGTISDTVPELNRIDLSRILVSIYGTKYISHPRLENIIRHNRITSKDFLTGKEEAAAFENKEFVKLHQSTLRKVDVLASIAERAYANDLDTLSTWWDKNGHSIKEWGELIKEHWLISTIVGLVSVISTVIKIWHWI